MRAPRSRKWTARPPRLLTRRSGGRQLSADPDISVRNGAELLDRLMKDVVTESVEFDVEKFMPLLRDRVMVLNPSTRQFLVSWITVLDSVPSINLLVHLPEFIGGLFAYLGDEAREIRTMTEAQLGEFLREINGAPPGTVALDRIVPILLANCSSKGTGDTRSARGTPCGASLMDRPVGGHADQLMQMTALHWINSFLSLARHAMMPFTPDLLAAIIPCLAHRVEQIRTVAISANQTLMKLVAEEEPRQPAGAGDGEHAAPDGAEAGPLEHFSIARTVDALTMQFASESEEARIAALRWILMLHQKAAGNVRPILHGSIAGGRLRGVERCSPRAAAQVFALVDVLFPALLKILSDKSDRVVSLGLQILAEISSYVPEGAAVQPAASSASGAKYSDAQPAYFVKFMRTLLLLFGTDQELLEKRGAFIVRHLSLLLSGTRIFRVLAELLETEEELEFARLMVQSLNLILLTAPELFDMRDQLRRLDGPQARELFTTLYRSWCHDPVATLCLCFLAQRYEHCAALVVKLYARTGAHARAPTSPSRGWVFVALTVGTAQCRYQRDGEVPCGNR